MKLSDDGLLEIRAESPFTLGDGENRFVRSASTPVQFKAPAGVAAYCREALFGETGRFEQEELWILLVNHKNVVTHEVLLYRGTQSGCQVRVAELYREAVRHGAAGIILVHTHPSGDATPSPEDTQITRQAREAGTLLDVQLLAHLVLG